ncbi:MAG: hypothetical protein JSU01_22945 [Bacteroidetes bacterium]|nr:hypothetical protein [Bacteroidota bacterium]
MNFIYSGFRRRAFNNTILRVIAGTALAVLTGGNALSQNYYFKHYNIENGLVQSQVRKIFEDSQKYLWLGTAGGVSRFDGTEFINYTKVDGLTGDLVNSFGEYRGKLLVQDEGGISAIGNGKAASMLSLPQGSVPKPRNLTIDKDGNIWFVSGSKLYALAGRKMTAISVTGKPDEKIRYLTRRKDGVLAVIVYRTGVFCRIGNTWVCKIPFTGTDRNIMFTKVLFDQINSSRTYLLSTSKLFQYEAGTLSICKNPILDTLKDILFSLAQDKTGNLWLGTEKGACYLRGNNSIRFTGENGFSNNAVNDIFIDDQENVWLGTNGDGFYKFQGLDLVSFNKIGSNPIKMVMSIGMDDSNRVWLGTEGQGVLIYHDGELKNFLLPSNSSLAQYVGSICHKKGQPLVLGTLAGLWMLDHGRFENIGKKYAFPELINTAIYDRYNTIWFVSDKGCYYLTKDGHAGLIENLNGDSQTIIEAGKDSMLVGNKQGLTLINHKSVDPSFRFKQLDSETVLSLTRYKSLIIGGTVSGGLFTIDLARKKFRRYTNLDGLRSNAIYSLLTDKNGVLWVGTGKGVDKVKIDPTNQNIKLVQDLNANPVTEFNQNSIFTLDDKVLLGSTNGLHIYSINQYPNIGQQKPQVNLESVRLYNQQNSPKSATDSAFWGKGIPPEIRYKYDEKHISIMFKGIFYPDPESVRYQYRLIGVDKQFCPLTRLNAVEYTSLSPGSYVFQVRAAASNGLFSGIRQIGIVVVPAFYQTTWFYAVLLVLFTIILLSGQWLINYRRERQRLLFEAVKQNEQVRVRRQTAEDLHDDIGNKLTRIVVLTDMLDRKATDQNKDVKSIIGQIRESAASLYSGAKDVLWALDPQSDDLHQILSRIKNFAIDLFSNTDVNVIFDDFDVFYSRSLPLEFSRNITMIFKELLNNILKHAHASQVILSAASDQNKLKLTLSDDGVGFTESSQKNGRGLANIKTRAGRINGDLRFHTSPGKGTTVILILELNAITDQQHEK